MTIIMSSSQTTKNRTLLSLYSAREKFKENFRLSIGCICYLLCIGCDMFGCDVAKEDHCKYSYIQYVIGLGILNTISMILLVESLWLRHPACVLFYDRPC